ncbi:uncharacterized protein VTP21DRAFT_10953 [Calcarisporiella thermophila]|uniref:uncharacterized protein n=1 Tax=Calcarisporiella thermophila TaxID=911321 RepID=UPI00374410FA
MSANLLRASRNNFIYGHRYDSTMNSSKLADTVSKASKASQGLLSKIFAMKNPIVYNAMVVKELAKEVYVREGMAFPSSAQWAQAKEAMSKALNFNYLKKLSIQDVTKTALYSVEVSGFFIIGEVIEPSTKLKVAALQVFPEYKHCHSVK